MPGEPFVPTFLTELPLAREALSYAQELHRGQRRSSDEAPFILHPLEVAALLQLTGHAEATVAAAILHDAVEDTEADVETITRRFGPEVGALVEAMTEDPGIESYEERKAALRHQIADFGEDAAAIYAADKVAKVRELRAHANRDPELLQSDREEVQPRLEHYVESLAMLEQATREHPLVQQLRFELEALRALPPKAGGRVKP
jgi:(p)ppGpp synthase/HD superfamily hydrolase